ncbi:hypothetical protein [Tropicimonas sp. S265A]|uniref:hypothetical protein n=1 Tax=Tropicimonas sp. S265A TaxID=3415134 RepID=UPI003C7B9422
MSFYAIEDDEHGAVVMEIKQVRIAKFELRTHAELFVKALQDKEPQPPMEVSGLVMTQTQEGAAISKDPAAAPPPSLEEIATDVEGRTAAAAVLKEARERRSPPSLPVVPKGAEAVPVEQMADPSRPKAKVVDSEEAAYKTAMSRLENGEKCAEVADDMGLPFGRLRAKWASRKRLQAKAVAERPDKVARKPAKWTDELELELLCTNGDAEKITAFADTNGIARPIVQAKFDAMIKDTENALGQD